MAVGIKESHIAMWSCVQPLERADTSSCKASQGRHAVEHAGRLDALVPTKLVYPAIR